MVENLDEKPKLECVKEEPTDSALDDLLLADASKDEDNETEQPKKRLKVKAEESGDDADGDAVLEKDVPVNLEAFPKELEVQDSGNSKLDGRYVRMETPSMGKPCYSMQGEAKTSYLYFLNKKWLIGFTFGGSKSMATVKAEGGRLPITPYPNAWKVMRKDKEGQESGKKNDEKKESKDKEVRLAMRIVIPETLHLWGPPEELSFTAARAGRSSTAKLSKPTPASSSTSAPPPAKTTKGSEDDFDELAAAQAIQNEQDSDVERNQASAAQSDASDSESSSVSSGSESESPEPPPKAAVSQQAAPPEDLQTRIQKFIERVAKTVDALKTPQDRNEKYKQVRKVIETNVQKANAVAGFHQSELHTLLQSMDRSFLSQRPMHGAAAPETPPDTAAAPSTPQEKAASGSSGNKPGHRHLEPSKSVLKRPGTRHREPWRQNRILFPAAETGHLFNKVPIVSWKGAGDELWFQSPGALVFCDQCKMQVHQGHGSLQGSPGRSQFAQNMFICNACQHPGAAWS